jgi:Tol biopolymer transport system component
MMRLRLWLMGEIASICACGVLLALAVGQIFVLPDNELVFNANLRFGESDIYRMDIAHRLIYPITQDGAVDSQPAWSPDGQQIAFVSNRKGLYTLYVMDANGGAMYRLADDGYYAFGPAWSPDGHFIAYITTQFPVSHEVMVMDIQSGKTRRLTDNREDENSVDWSPDGQQLAVDYDTNTAKFRHVFTLNTQTGERLPLFTTSSYERSPNWAPDGRYLLYMTGGDKTGIYLWDATRSESRLLYAPAVLNISDVNWSPDGRFIVYAPLTTSNQNIIFKLDVAVCLQQPDQCVPQALPLPPGIYANPSWRPRPS